MFVTIRQQYGETVSAIVMTYETFRINGIMLLNLPGGSTLQWSVERDLPDTICCWIVRLKQGQGDFDIVLNIAGR